MDINNQQDIYIPFRMLANKRNWTSTTEISIFIDFIKEMNLEQRFVEHLKTIEQKCKELDEVLNSLEPDE